MKADITRSTFERENHYSGVREQQGRVHTDADHNEQVDIQHHLERTANTDVIGTCGAPIHAAGFEITVAAGEVRIGAGRYYADGILCEHEAEEAITAQADLPGYALPQDEGIYAAYLDAWESHVTALEDPRIREVALGGPDTATRSRVVAQVKLLRAGDTGEDVTCLTPLEAWDALLAGSTGTLAARAEPEGDSDEPCIVPARAGFRGLENQLYRVEVHALAGADEISIKWSRENGSVLVTWIGQDATDVNRLTLGSTGRDEVLGLTAGDWIELTDDARELRGEAGLLVEIQRIDGAVVTIDPHGEAVDHAAFGANPKARRWDSPGAIAVDLAAPDNWIDLESGVQVLLSAGTYSVGDYWLIPARTVTADIEWPRDAANAPLAQAPDGIAHHYCRLALLGLTAEGEWTVIDDCRELFPPLTELLQLQYVSGDGQEGLPSTQLDAPFQVGVLNGQWPVAGARVRFTRENGDGALLTGGDAEESGSDSERIVITGADGIAECNYRLATAGSDRTQLVLATLLDVADAVVGVPVRFNASLSLASHVYYDGEDCATLAEVDTVQDAIHTIAEQALLLPYAGDGQQATPGQPLPLPLVVSIVNVCGTIEGARVRFTPEGAGSRVAATIADIPGATPGAAFEAVTGSDGLAAVAWQLDPNLHQDSQRLLTELIEAGGRPLHAPAGFTFTGSFAAGRNCYDFLDELRFDGVVRDADGVLGLAVSELGARVQWTAGIAYVGGCRLVVDAGELALDPGTLPNTVIVDPDGQVVLLEKGNEPRSCAVLADVYIVGDRIVRIVDLRLDLTHLDLRVNDVDADTQSRRADRRAAIPALTQSLRALRYRDGRNHRIQLSSDSDMPYGLAYDGTNVWAANTVGTDVLIVNCAGFPGAPLERVELGNATVDAVYDGVSHVWFSSPFSAGGDIVNNLVYSVDVRTRAVTSYVVGEYPFRMVSDGGRIWVGNFQSASLTVIDTGRGQVVATIPLIARDGEGALPTALAYDGEFAWVTTFSGLFRVSANFEAEWMPNVSDNAGWWLTFDGSQLWELPTSGGLRRYDVSSGISGIVDGVNGVTAMATDASNLWVLTPSEPTFLLTGVRCATGDRIGSITLPGAGMFVGGMAFDGAHLWYSSVEENGNFIGRVLTV